MELNKKDRLNHLFDLYNNLLTKHQREIFNMYYMEDLSLFEIASIKKTSRNAVYNLLNRVVKILENYEKKLNLYSKYQKILDQLNKTNIDKEKIIKILEDN